MREILFRGKRLDNGDWVEGYLYEHEPPLVGIVSEKDEPEASKWFIARTGFADWNMSRPVELVEVDPSTVGQYTGLNDKNGNRIFEGDILSIWNDRNDVVVFEDGAFIMEDTEIPMRFAIKFEVIGNVHDNPEFMKGDADNG